MLNFRVRDLDAMLAQLRNKGANVSNETQELEGVGRFGWVTDPEGTGSSCGSRPDARFQAPRLVVDQCNGEAGDAGVAADVARFHFEEVRAVRVPGGVEVALQPEVEHAWVPRIVLSRVGRVDGAEVGV